MDNLIGLDFETYGAVDLPTHGLDRYASDETFLPLLASVKFAEGNQAYTYDFDFVQNKELESRNLRDAIGDKTIVAHNAGFERRVLHEMGFDLPASRFIDSAVVSRAMGAASSLEAAAPQLLGVDKVELGKDLIKLFSIPGPYQEKHGTRHFVQAIVQDHLKEWADYKYYCGVDAALSYDIIYQYLGSIPKKELRYAAITLEMSGAGWPVDVARVEEMQRRYLENQAVALEAFRRDLGAHDLNLNSLKQLKEWCAERGIRASSFDEANVAKLKDRIELKLEDSSLPREKYDRYAEVHRLLDTKQILGGSSLKKLQVILDTVGADGRLRDQYLHCGAGQTWRTTGRSTQMQNLKRIGDSPADMTELDDPSTDWSNTELARNLRQVFTSSHPQGALIVGDFSSVESRGLAWQAGAAWKVEAFRKGQDLYKVLAAKIYNIHYDYVLKPQRQTGKVGELSCGYGAGADAVQAFAEGMGVKLTEGEAAKLVYDWRDANPEVVAYWERLDTMLHEVIERKVSRRLSLPDGLELGMHIRSAPASLRKQVGDWAQSLVVEIRSGAGDLVMVRYFHGVGVRGRNINYFKPTSRKTGDLWVNSYVDPKTKQRKLYNLYGGKLAGILTQSFCRELFFQTLAQVQRWADQIPNVTVIGQFHDEIVLDWVPTMLDQPGWISLHLAMLDFEQIMSDPGPVRSFPLGADIKYDYRYTK